MAILRISTTEARQLAVRAAMLDVPPADELRGEKSRHDDLIGMVRAIGMLRVELTSTVAPSAEHIAWTRLGASFRATEIDDALKAGRLFERGWMLRPIEDLGLYLAGMRTWSARSGAARWVDDNAAFADSILDRIADLGPLTSREIPDEAVVPWPSTGWTNNRNVTQMLECLHMSGRLAVIGREGRLRVWDLASAIYPAVEEIDPDEARRVRSEQLLRACGVMRDSIAVSPFELHGNLRVGEAAEIDGVTGKWRVDPVALERLRSGDEFVGRTAILSPFDRLLTDKQRHTKVFDFDYWLEIYKPAEQRIWGQFALPILHGERLVGKLDARSDRAAGRFVVHRIHEDVPFDRALRGAVDDQIDRLAEWLHLDPVTAPA